MVARRFMPESGPGDVTRLLQAWNCGDQNAVDQMVPFVYRELRRLAAAYLRRERPDHTLQPTALVNEAYLRLIDQIPISGQNHSQFLAVAANLMRQILVNHAKRRRSLKRWGGHKVELEEAAGLQPATQLDVVILDEAMRNLAKVDPRQSRVVELRYFGGLTEEEIAEVLGVSIVTVKRDWRIARAVLHDELTRSRTGSAGL